MEATASTPTAEEPATSGPEREIKPVVSYRAVTRDRLLIAACVVDFLVTFGALGSLSSGVPIWVVSVSDIPASIIGVAFVANVVVVVTFGQNVGAWAVRRGDRAHVIIAAAGIFGACWLIISTDILILPGAIKSMTVVVAFAAIAVGEVLISRTLPVLVNDIAPANAIGRYNALYQFAGQAGMFSAPLLAGLMLGGSARGYYMLVLSGICLAAAVASTRLAGNQPAQVGRFP
jgi:hypothetical protein